MGHRLLDICTPVNRNFQLRGNRDAGSGRRCDAEPVLGLGLGLVILIVTVIDSTEEQHIRGGITVKHPASIMQLSWIVDEFGYSPKRVTAYLHQIREPQPVPETMAWAKPYYERLLELYREAIR